MSNCLDRAVHSVLDDFFAAAPQRGATPSMRLVTAPAAPRRFAPGLVAIGSGMTAAAGIAGVLVVTNRADHSPAASSPVDSTAGTSAAPTTAAGNPGFQVTVLPDGLVLSQVRPAFTVGDASERPDGGTVWMILGRRDEPGTIVDKIDVSVDYGRTFSPSPTAGYTREAITLAGVPGEIVRDVNGDQVIVEYQLGEQAVQVQAAAGDDEQMLNDMVQIANGLTVGDGTAELTGPLPVGYELLTSGPWHAEADNSEPTTLSYGDPSNVNAISVSFEVNPPADFQYWFMGIDLTETTVRGQQAFVTNRPGDVDGDTEPSVMWLARPDLMITVSGTGDISVDDVLEAAESLQPMTDNDWQELEATAGQSLAPGVTTTIVATNPPTRTG